MPRFRPFPGLRYDRSVPLDKVIAPPYDVVGPTSAPCWRRVTAPTPSTWSSRPRPPDGAGQVPLRGPDLRHLARGRGPRARGRAGLLRVPDDGPRGPVHHRGHRGAGLRAPGRRHPAPRADHPEGQERPARPVAGVPGQPLPHLGPVAVAGWRPPTSPTGRPMPRPSTTTGWSTRCGCSTRPTCRRDHPGRRGRAGGDRRRPSPLRDRARLPGRAPGRARRGPGDHDLVMALVVELSEGQLSVGPIHRTITGVPPGTDLAPHPPPRALAQPHDLPRPRRAVLRHLDCPGPRPHQGVD